MPLARASEWLIALAGLVAAGCGRSASPAAGAEPTCVEVGRHEHELVPARSATSAQSECEELRLTAAEKRCVMSATAEPAYRACAAARAASQSEHDGFVTICESPSRAGADRVAPAERPAVLATWIMAHLRNPEAIASFQAVARASDEQARWVVRSEAARLGITRCPFADAPPRWPDVTLAQSSNATEVPADAVEVVIKPGQVAVEGRAVTDLDEHLRELAEGLRILATRNPSWPFRGELVLVADARTTHGAVVDAVTTANASGFPVVQMVVAGARGAPAAFTLAPSGAPAPDSQRTGHVAIHVRADGISVSRAGSPLGPGCRATSRNPSTPTLPLLNGALAVEALTTCLAQMRRPDGTSATVLAPRDRSWGDVVRVIDAARATFPDILIVAD